MLANFEKRAYNGTERVWTGRYRNLHNLPHWHLENELICVKAEKNEYGQFMQFENITYAPIDLDGIDPDEMTCREKKMLNAYHKMVWEKISPYLNDDEREWLKEYTREI
mgnify:CR=1 FL=1